MCVQVLFLLFPEWEVLTTRSTFLPSRYVKIKLLLDITMHAMATLSAAMACSTVTQAIHTIEFQISIVVMSGCIDSVQ